MKMRALKDNKTLNITKGKEYKAWIFMDAKGLLLVENNIGDEVVMSKYDFYDFKEEEK